MTTDTSPTVSRRAVTTAAWVAPTIVLAIGSPAASASGDQLRVQPENSSIGSVRTVNLRVTVTDASGAPRAGAPVSMTTGASGVTFRPASGTTDGAGVFTTAADVAANAPTQTALVTALSGGGSASGSFRYTTPADQTIQCTVAPSSTVRGNSVTTTATALDPSGGLIVGQALTFSSSDAAVTLSSASGSTGAGGAVATPATVAPGTAAGNATLTASNGTRTGSAALAYPAPNTVATTAVSQYPIACAVGPDGRVYASVGSSVSILDPVTLATIRTVSVSGTAYGLAVSPDGSRVYVCVRSPAQVDVVSLTSFTVIGSVAVGFNPANVVISADGSTGWVTNGAAYSVSRFSTATLTETARIGVGTSPDGLALTPDGGRLFVTNLQSDNVSVVDTATSQVVATVAVGARPMGVAMGATPNGPAALVGCYDGGVVSAIRLSNLTVTTPITGVPATRLAVSADKARAYVCNGANGQVFVYDLQTFARIARVSVGTNPNDIAIGVGELRAYVAATTGRQLTALNLGKTS